MPAPQRFELRGGGGGRRPAAHPVGHLFADLPAGQGHAAAGPAHDLGGVRPVEVGGEGRAPLHGASLQPTVPLVQRRRRLPAIGGGGEGWR
ncbi:MAG: hypothetical protein ACRDJ9_26970, partial [Dehalococcoidia bacterium]